MLRKCKNCGLEAYTEEDLELFTKSKTGKHGRSNRCRSCDSGRAKAWREDNKERFVKYQKQWNRANRGQRLEYQKQWREDNKQYLAGLKKQWQKNNPDKVNATSAKYRASKLNATPVWTDHEIINDFYLEARYHSMEVDHIVPLQSDLVCGLHTEHNLQLLSKEDNVSKLNRKWPDQW